MKHPERITPWARRRPFWKLGVTWDFVFILAILAMFLIYAVMGVEGIKL